MKEMRSRIPADVKHTIRITDFKKAISSWNKLWPLRRQCIFAFPALLDAWWREFSADSKLYLCEISEEDAVIGMAPLYLKENTAFFIGSSDVFDYLDFIIAPKKEDRFFNILLENLTHTDVYYLSLSLVRPDSTVSNNLIELARSKGFKVSYNLENVLLEMELPRTWEEYLAKLTLNHRHDLKRKFRRFEEAGNMNYRIIEDSKEIIEGLDIFLKLFRESRKDKAAFMTVKMERFFRLMAEVMAEAQLLKLCILELDMSPVAATICFDDGDTVYLYNNGYDPQYNSLSPGLLSKALTIKHSIQEGRKMFNFLKGNEKYKYHLGGKETQLFNCKIALDDRST